MAGDWVERHMSADLNRTYCRSCSLVFGDERQIQTRAF